MQLYTALSVGSFRGFNADFADVTFEEVNEIFYSICLKDEHHALIDKAFSDVCQRPVSAQFHLNRQDQPALPGASLDENGLFDSFGRENVDIVD